ncbi:heavy metal-associated isoprenylated plant protein 5-like isoform X3 [Nymphaea colorata]|nr:heavy metal-associated isoprenylated plant protein 5-like isoform X3 [Nymphaea colorata]
MPPVSLRAPSLLQGLCVCHGQRSSSCRKEVGDSEEKRKEVGDSEEKRKEVGDSEEKRRESELAARQQRVRCWLIDRRAKMVSEPAINSFEVETGGFISIFFLCFCHGAGPFLVTV